MSNSPTHMYFIRCGDEGPIKIGISFDSEKRLRALQTACPYSLELIHATGPLVDAPAYEAWMHEHYASIRLQGEWFLPTDSLLRHISQIISFDEDMAREQAA